MTESRTLPALPPSAPDPADGTPIAFTPAPNNNRRDGWTPARQSEFIVQLARLGLVSAAARAVGMSPKSTYALLARDRKRRCEEWERTCPRDEDGSLMIVGEGRYDRNLPLSFAQAWDAALEMGRDHARDIAIDRAINGTEIPVFYRGRQVGTRVRHHNRLIVAALNAFEPAPPRPPRKPRAPQSFGEPCPYAAELEAQIAREPVHDYRSDPFDYRNYK